MTILPEDAICIRRNNQINQSQLTVDVFSAEEKSKNSAISTSNSIGKLRAQAPWMSRASSSRRITKIHPALESESSKKAKASPNLRPQEGAQSGKFVHFSPSGAQKTNNLRVVEKKTQCWHQNKHSVKVYMTCSDERPSQDQRKT